MNFIFSIYIYIYIQGIYNHIYCIGNFIIPTDLINIFQMGGSTTNLWVAQPPTFDDSSDGQDTFEVGEMMNRGCWHLKCPVSAAIVSSTVAFGYEKPIAMGNGPFIEVYLLKMFFF